MRRSLFLRTRHPSPLSVPNLDRPPLLPPAVEQTYRRRYRRTDAISSAPSPTRVSLRPSSGEPHLPGGPIEPRPTRRRRRPDPTSVVFPSSSDRRGREGRETDDRSPARDERVWRRVRVRRCRSNLLPLSGSATRGPYQPRKEWSSVPPPIVRRGVRPTDRSHRSRRIRRHRTSVRARPSTARYGPEPGRRTCGLGSPPSGSAPRPGAPGLRRWVAPPRMRTPTSVVPAVFFPSARLSRAGIRRGPLA